MVYLVSYGCVSFLNSQRGMHKTGWFMIEKYIKQISLYSSFVRGRLRTGQNQASGSKANSILDTKCIVLHYFNPTFKIYKISKRIIQIYFLKCNGI
jgi:hypothetical protein